jgi:hypothetical protein
MKNPLLLLMADRLGDLLWAKSLPQYFPILERELAGGQGDGSH